MLRPMKRLWLMLLLCGPLPLAAQQAADQPAPVAAGEKAPPDAREAIPASIASLKPPRLDGFAGGIQMAVSTSSELAQKHVVAGLNHLHCGWEFEASRHFAVALREDPDCLLAHWGMAMALLDASPETADARRASIERLALLLNAGQGSELERGYAYGLIKYLTEGAGGAATSFRKVANRFPNDMQAAIFSALFNRGGYDFTGSATPDQEAAERDLLALIEKHPDNPIPLNALLTIRAEAPSVEASLPLARKLCQLLPGYAPAFHLLGHYEWRSGNHARAAAAFGRASTFYQKWMQQSGVEVAGCPEWIMAECYRVVALLSMGDYDTAHAAALQVAATPLPADRLSSAGARFLLWEAKTLPARILIHRGLKDSFVEASKSLPTPEEVKPTMKLSTAYLWIDGLRLTLEGHKRIDADQLEEARVIVATLDVHMSKMDETEQLATVLGERSQWLRARTALKILVNDLRGRIAMEGPEDMRAMAFNWYSSAIDNQRHSSMLHPPMLLTPMSARLGDFFLKTGEAQQAITHYGHALEMIPSDIHSLQGLRQAYIEAGDTRKAAEIGVRIEQLKNP